MRVSRRGLLAGGAAGGAAVVGVGVLVEQDVIPGRSAVYRRLGLTGADGTIPDVEPGAVERGTLTTRHVTTSPEWVIAYPPGVEPGRAHGVLPAVVVLHMAGSSAEAVFDRLGLDRFLAASGAPMALAAVDGGTHSYWQAHGDDDPGSMVLEDFLPMLARRGLSVEAPGWLGWSMGGYGVLRLAALRLAAGSTGPVAAVSPALWPEYSQTAPGAFESEQQYDEAMALLAREPRPDTRIDCGTADPFFRNVEDFADGASIETHFEAGDHTPGYWTRVLPAQLDWLAQRLI